MVLSGRVARADAARPGDAQRSGVSERRADMIDGIGVHSGDAVATWSSISEVAVVTRRSLRGGWFGLEVLSDDVGLVLVDGSDALVEPFLAESYRLAGFDHSTLANALAETRPRAVCYRR